ncbi:hypothetical protein LSH36_800g00039 [Paralvinella palmiformis]|uniref:Ribosome production factor 2 homolog n=1 Tax=Paralvinella palmiformis TaxID=53620 RepID=A0AAD9J0X4_9ANNE|nr:hypothetical protein LSH36_800g00039 [Paralvinella palmiformis]
MLKKPLSVLYKKKNILRPFDDATSIEFFSNKSDAALFMFGSHSKKRPHNLIIGRLFDYHILDMIELGVEKFKSLSSFQTAKCPFGTKPCLVFTGEDFELNSEHQRLKNLLLDFFSGPKTKQVRLSGLEHIWHFTAAEGKIFWRSYRILMKKSGSRIPRIELEEIGPSLDLVIRRTKLASDDLYKRSRKQPKQAKPKKVKNVSMDAFGTKLGRIHMTKQNLDSLQTRKMKGLKRKSDEGAEDEEKMSRQINKLEKTWTQD